MTIDEVIEVLQAAKVGKQIQARTKDSPAWGDVHYPPEAKIDTFLFEYRVKPEPRELCLQYIGGGLWQEKFEECGQRFREVLE